MAAPDEATLAYWSEQRSQLRQSETQRSVLTNYVLTIAAAVSGFVIQQHFRLQTLPLSVLVVLTGLYGAVSAAKYHERASPLCQAVVRRPPLSKPLTPRGRDGDNFPI